VELVSCPYFTTSVYDLTQEMTVDYSELDSFVIFICIEGRCTVRNDQGETVGLQAGESLLLPATTRDVHIQPEGKVKFLETWV
jgi:mannose-6-phosphate isomerase